MPPATSSSARPARIRSGIGTELALSVSAGPATAPPVASSPSLGSTVSVGVVSVPGALEPPPTALVANLAYNIAIPLIMTTIAELPSVRRWAVMVQRELGERLFAVPSTKAYAAVSVLTQLACRLEKTRPVPASAFRSRPRVESSFVTFVRREAAGAGDLGAPDAAAATAPGPAEYAAVSRLVRLAFGQRRKTLVNSLGGAAHAHLTLSRDDVRAALRGLDTSEAARPEELAPPQWLTFARTVGRA